MLIEPFPFLRKTLYDNRLFVTEPFYFLLPLIFQGGGADNEAFCKPEKCFFHNRGGDCLKGLTQSHLIGNNGSFAESRKSYPFCLVREELGVQQGEVQFFRFSYRLKHFLVPGLLYLFFYFRPDLDFRNFPRVTNKQQEVLYLFFLDKGTPAEMFSY